MDIVGNPRPNRHAQPAARPQRLGQIAKGREVVGEKHDPKPRRQQIDARRLKRVGLRVCEQRRQVGNAAFGDTALQQPEHRLGDIDTRHMAARTDRGGERQGRRAGPAADIENPLSGLRLCFAQQDLRDLDIARFLDFGALDPTRPRDLVPVPPHRRIRIVGAGRLLGHLQNPPHPPRFARHPLPAGAAGGEREFSSASPRTDG